MDSTPTLSSKLRKQQHIFLSLLFLVLSFFHTLTAAELTVSSEQFTEQEICTGRILKPEFCQNAVPALRSLLDCSAVCAGSSECATFVWDADREHNICRLCNSLAEQDCFNTEVNSRVTSFEKQGACANGGTASASGACQCIGPYGGENCRIRMKDCQDWGEAGYEGGVRYIYPDLAPAPFQAWCRVLLRRTYISSHIHTSWNFTRGWNEYRDGFGELNPSIGDHWLGLDNIHALTHSRDYKLIAEMYLQNGTYYQQYYYDFKVSDEFSNYALSFSATQERGSASLGDCLTDVIGKPFSTYDADHDDVTENCALRHQSGWWFGNCTLCNPNGVLVMPADGILSGAPEEVFWYPGFGNRAPSKVHLWLTR